MQIVDIAVSNNQIECPLLWNIWHVLLLIRVNCTQACSGYYYSHRNILDLDLPAAAKGSSLALLSTKRLFPFVLYQRNLLKHVAVHCRPYTQSWLP